MNQNPQQLPLDLNPSSDICRKRHGGNSQSMAANTRVTPSKAAMRERIRVYIYACTYMGATSAEIEQVFGWAKNRFSGRISELKQQGVIFASGRVRDGCMVLVGRREWITASGHKPVS